MISRAGEESVAPAVRHVAVLPHLVRLKRDPTRFFANLSRQIGNGQIVRLDLGPIKPVLVTAPEDVEQVLRSNVGNYRREGMMWRPITRLQGTGLSGEGANWERSRKMMAPLFTRRRVDDLTDTMATTIYDAVTDLALRAGDRPVDVAQEMTRIVYRAMGRAFFGDRITEKAGDVLAEGVATAFQSLGSRMIAPYMPDWFPMPGDRRFRKAVKRVDDIVYPLVRDFIANPGRDDAVATWIAHANRSTDTPLTEQEIRDNLVALCVAGTETTSVALTWLWVALKSHPHIAATIREEVRRVVGTERPARHHLTELHYTRAALAETLRLYPGSWVLPRTAVDHDTIGGAPIRPGDTILLSPYLTHRLPDRWPDPEVFDPRRFADPAAPRHRNAYMPFSDGPHICLGQQLFDTEALLTVATMLADFDVHIGDTTGIAPRAAVSTQPNRPVTMRLLARSS